MFTSGTVARTALGMMLVAGAVPQADAFHTSSLPHAAAARDAKCGMSSLAMAASAEGEKKMGFRAKLAAAVSAISIIGAAPFPAAAAGAATKEPVAFKLELSESQIKVAAISAVAAGGAVAILANSGAGGSKRRVMGPGMSKTLGNSIAWKKPEFSSLSKGVSLDDKAAMQKVYEQTAAIRTGTTFPLGVALAQIDGVDMLDPSKINSICQALPDKLSFEEFTTAVLLYTGKSVSWADKPSSKQATRTNL